MTIVWGVLVLCLGFWLFQVILLNCFLREMRVTPASSARASSTVPVAWPKFFVVMPLRGADHSLRNALECLQAQEYPDFEIRIVVDHDADPAWEIVRRFIVETGSHNVHASTLRSRIPDCSLMCSSELQILEDLKDMEGLVAFCAADMQPSPNWLREMAITMADPAVGTTLGNRWYQPPCAWWGSLVQYLWNAAAIVPMWLFEIPWSGAMAMRLSDIRSSRITEKWRRAMTEDAPVKEALSGIRLSMRFSPQLFVIDRGDISLARAWQFIYRQLLWTRLYHPHWNWAVVNGVSTTAILFAPLIAALLMLLLGEGVQSLLLFTIGLAYILGSALLALMLDRSVTGILRARGEDASSFGVVTWLRILAAIPLTQATYATAMICAAFAREVTWRGIRYRLDGPWDVRMLDYRPYSESS